MWIAVSPPAPIHSSQSLSLQLIIETVYDVDTNICGDHGPGPGQSLVTSTNNHDTHLSTVYTRYDQGHFVDTATVWITVLPPKSGHASYTCITSRVTGDGTRVTISMSICWCCVTLMLCVWLSVYHWWQVATGTTGPTPLLATTYQCHHHHTSHSPPTGVNHRHQVKIEIFTQHFPSNCLVTPSWWWCPPQCIWCHRHNAYRRCRRPGRVHVMSGKNSNPVTWAGQVSAGLARPRPGHNHLLGFLIAPIICSQSRGLE